MTLKNSLDVSRFGLWLLVGIYTYLLQYAVIIWFFLNENIGESFARKTSPFIILLICIFLIVLFIQQKKSVKNHLAKILTIFSVILFVSLSQPQPQKLIHVPEYIILSFIVYVALKIDLHNNYIFPLTLIITTYLGIIDELLQGIHPFRYYGSEDMLVNSLSALAGVCIISVFKNNKMPYPKKDHYPKLVLLCILVIAILAVLSGVNVFALFDEAARQTHFQNFTISLLIMNIISFIIGIIVLILICFYNKFYSSDVIVSICSIIVILETIIGIVLFCNFSSVEFL